MWLFYRSPIKLVTLQNDQGSGSFSCTYIVRTYIDAYSEHCQTSKTEVLAKIVNG